MRDSKRNAPSVGRELHSMNDVTSVQPALCGVIERASVAFNNMSSCDRPARSEEDCATSRIVPVAPVGEEAKRHCRRNVPWGDL